MKQPTWRTRKAEKDAARKPSNYETGRVRQTKFDQRRASKGINSQQLEIQALVRDYLIDGDSLEDAFDKAFAELEGI